MFLAKIVRVAFFFASLAALSWRILLHLLWPDLRAGLETKVRRHCAQIEGEGIADRVNGARGRKRVVIGSERVLHRSQLCHSGRTVQTRVGN
jgi:hypothetical protein